MARNHPDPQQSWGGKVMDRNEKHIPYVGAA